MASRPSGTQSDAESPRNTWSAWSRRLALYRVTIVVFTLHAIAQVALQTTLILVGKKAYQELTEADCGLDPGSEAISNMQSRAMWENIALILLHTFAWMLYVYTTLRSLSLHVPFVAILFATSFGSSLAQYMSMGTLSCTEGALARMLIAETARHILSAVATGYLIFWSVHWNASLLPQATPVASLSTCGFLVLGIVVMALAPKGRTPGPVLWVWLGFAVVCACLSIVLLLARRFMLKEPDHGSADPTNDFLLRQSASFVGALASTSSPKSSDPAPFVGPPTAAHKASAAPLSTPAIEYHTSLEGSMTDYPRDQRDLGSTHNSNRLVGCVETFNVTLDPVRAPTDEENLLSVDRYTSTSREVQRQGVAHVEVAPYSSSDNSSSAVEEDISNRNDHDTRLRFVSDRDNAPSPQPPPSTLNSPHRPSPSAQRYPPVSYAFSDRSRSPISRSSTTASSTPTVPPYSAGPYPFNGRRDTLSSDHTYETLPSYHSRRSTQTFLSMSTHGVRSLPPIPPLPPSASLSSVPSPSFPASSSHLDTPISSEREGITVGTPELSEQ
ncbi:hypothetical protein PQX77_001240 [Marasmius sp. AFHP31]|nr:hypothetical protein PQX77_001240 [Marasmius sp. AFHP31]